MLQFYVFEICDLIFMPYGKSSFELRESLVMFIVMLCYVYLNICR